MLEVGNVGQLRSEIFTIKLNQLIVDTPIQREGIHLVKLSYLTTKTTRHMVNLINIVAADSPPAVVASGLFYQRDQPDQLKL